MFGLLRPTTTLTCGQRSEFNRFYCGLCKGLDHHHGAVTRGLLSYDGVFVSLLVDALVDEAAAAKNGSCRCPLLPVVQRPIVKPDSVAMTYAASVQMLLFDQWAADGGRSLVRRFSRGHATKAHARLDELGVSLRALEGFERVQADVEHGDATPTEAAAPTANALALVFGTIAGLPGALGRPETNVGHLVPPDPANSGKRTDQMSDVHLAPRDPAKSGKRPDQMSDVHLRELGAAVGRAIYLVDALEDLDRDIRKGEFNPCIVRGRREERRVAECVRVLRADVAAMPRHLDALPLARHASVLRDIVTQLGQRAEHAIAEVDRARPPMRLRALAIAAAVFVWAWLCAIPKAFAAVAPHNAGADAGVDAGTPLFPELPPFPTTAPTPTPKSPPTPAPSSSTSKPQTHQAGSGCPCTDLWNGLCGENSCCNSCNNCCTNCGDCGSSCDRCCSGVNGCCGGGGGTK